MKWCMAYWRNLVVLIHRVTFSSHWEFSCCHIESDLSHSCSISIHSHFMYRNSMGASLSSLHQLMYFCLWKSSLPFCVNNVQMCFSSLSLTLVLLSVFTTMPYTTWAHIFSLVYSRRVTCLRRSLTQAAYCKRNANALNVLKDSGTRFWG